MNVSTSGLFLSVVGLCVGAVGIPTAQANIIAQFDFFSSPGTEFIEPFYTNYHIDQTFTTTQSGTLASVDVPIVSLTASNPDHLPLNVSIQPLSTAGFNGPQPTGTLLSTGSIADDDAQFGGFTIKWINIPMTPTTLQAGQSYALVATVGSPGDTYPNEAYDWYSKYENDQNNQPIDLYSGGQLAISQDGTTYGQQTNYDLPFRINATVPEPAGLTLLGVGGIALLRRRRRSCIAAGN